MYIAATSADDVSHVGWGNASVHMKHIDFDFRLSLVTPLPFTVFAAVRGSTNRAVCTGIFLALILCAVITTVLMTTAVALFVTIGGGGRHTPNSAKSRHHRHLSSVTVVSGIISSSSSFSTSTTALAFFDSLRSWYYGIRHLRRRHCHENEENIENHKLLGVRRNSLTELSLATWYVIKTASVRHKYFISSSSVKKKGILQVLGIEWRVWVTMRRNFLFLFEV